MMSRLYSTAKMLRHSLYHIQNNNNICQFNCRDAAVYIMCFIIETTLKVQSESKLETSESETKDDYLNRDLKNLTNCQSNCNFN